MCRSKYHFDQAATSFPKPAGVAEAVLDYMQRLGANPGRGAYIESTLSGELLFDCREKIGNIIGASNPMRVILTSSATLALNMAIQGSVHVGDHVITTSLEHNSTIRVLRELELQGRIELTIVTVDPRNEFDLSLFDEARKANTTLLVCNHASNVWGTLIPLRTLMTWAKNANLISIVDGSQSVGSVKISMEDDGIDILCFPGHKSLLGPMGTGVMAIHPRFDMQRLHPILFGGTGSHSANIEQPQFLPDAFESGTLNIPGFAGLNCSLDVILKKGVENIHIQKSGLARYFSNALSEIPFYQQYLDPKLLETGVVSFNHMRLSPSELGDLLGKNHGVACRVGLHCSPLAHQTVGSFPDGTVRFSFSDSHQKEDIENVIDILRGIGA